MLFGRRPPEVTSRIDICMNTAMSQTVYGPGSRGAATAALREVQRLEQLLNRFRPDSDVGRLNRSASMKDATPVHRDTAHVLWAALEMSRLSAGAFDVTAAPLVSLWKVTADDPGIPSAEAISRARDLVDYRCLEVFRSAATPLRGPVYAARLKRPGQMVDLGGIAKGYAADRALDVYRRRGIASAAIDLGGNVALLGGKEDGSPWRVGIQDPDAPRGDCLGYLSLRDKSAVTSGDYERFFEAGGRRYHHIIDPRTGYPAESGLRSVTVVASESMIADGLSTALFILGLRQGLEMLEKTRQSPSQEMPRAAGLSTSFRSVEAIFVTSDRKVHITSGLAGAYTSLDPSKQPLLIDLW